MNNVAIAFSTRDRVELSRQSVEPLLQPDKFDLFWIDGSSSDEGQRLPAGYETKCWAANVVGGADAAIVYKLTALLQHSNKYEFVGLVENDVLLDPAWFDDTMLLFSHGEEDGLEVGAVSARCYEDRILLARAGYAVMHNLGAGQVIFSRKAAEIVLQNFRTGWTTENRRLFQQLSRLDLARWSPFIQQQHVCCADWTFDRVLAQHGLASLALTPSKCRMIGQEPSLEEQGLKLVGDDDLSHFHHDAAFETYRFRTAAIRAGTWVLPDSRFMQSDDGSFTVFPHQAPMLGGGYAGDWQLKWCQGFGPFAWQAGEPALGSGWHVKPVLFCPVSGPCSLIVSGGEHGGKIEVADEQSGYEMKLDLQAEGPTGAWLNLAMPGTIAYRNVRLTALTPGICFYGLSTREPQPYNPAVCFEHGVLPCP